MPRALPKKLTSWSFSRYSDYVQCPLKAKLKHIDKIFEPKNDAMQRGADIHTLCEKYIKGELPKLPKELKLFENLFKDLKARYKKRLQAMVVEDQWAFTKDWTQTQWNDWAACVVRIKLDCAWFVDEDTLIIDDFKTGKFRPEKNAEYIEQLELYALAALLLYTQEGLKVKPRLIYLDTGDIYPPEDEPMVFTHADLPRLKKLWEKRTKPLLNDTTFAPRPNNLCRWCFFRASNKAAGGGQCKY